MEEHEEFERRRALMLQARGGDRSAQTQLWRLYQVTVTPGKEISASLLNRVHSRMGTA